MRWVERKGSFVDDVQWDSTSSVDRRERKREREAVIFTNEEITFRASKRDSEQKLLAESSCPIFHSTLE